VGNAVSPLSNEDFLIDYLEHGRLFFFSFSDPENNPFLSGKSALRPLILEP